ncbi:Uncharacterised protein [uncultured archaeon]|nr:Uncharacterised protein [uncultured archaeon]
MLGNPFELRIWSNSIQQVQTINLDIHYEDMRKLVPTLYVGVNGIYKPIMSNLHLPEGKQQRQDGKKYSLMCVRNQHEGMVALTYYFDPPAYSKFYQTTYELYDPPAYSKD